MDRPEIPNDRPSTWNVGEDGNWTEGEFLAVESQRQLDDFGGDVPTLDGLAVGGVWSGAGEPNDFTVAPVEVEEFPEWEARQPVRRDGAPRHGPEWDLCFWVPGKPQTAGSKTRLPITKGGEVIAHRVVESGDRDAKADWRRDLRAEAAQRIEDYGKVDGYSSAEWPTDRPLFVQFTFVRKRPATHYGTGRNAGLLKGWAIQDRPTTRPDALKLARAAEDALTGVVWFDDSLIVDERLQKVYPDQIGRHPGDQGVLIGVRRLDTAGGNDLP